MDLSTARNVLRRVPAGAERNTPDPMDRPAVTVRLDLPDGEVRLPGRAVAWIGDAVQVRVWDGGLQHEVWLPARDVARRD